MQRSVVVNGSGTTIQHGSERTEAMRNGGVTRVNAAEVEVIYDRDTQGMARTYLRPHDQIMELGSDS